ncbi:hypothetical protein Sango_2935400 [Sesamum angolense]|uniref:Uncharacterized protein n=1 Tax=Sesamum angolense TaxID=2727404 RepID=A0AAE1T5Y4_9LAMI|nr:hypothetical protein Sango_2935400 [Sesamum angolense]
MAESRYTGHVEDELRRNPSRGHYGGSSKGSTSGAKHGISQSYGIKSGVEMPSTGFDPHMFPSSNKIIKDMLSKEGMKKVGKAVSKFFIFNALPFNAADSGPYMQSMIDTIAEVGPGVKGPSGYQIDEEWTREAEEPLLAKKDLDWLDEEGRMENVPNDEDDDALLPLSRYAQVSSSRKDKHVLHSSSHQNDSDEETAEDDDNDDDDDDDNDGDDGGDNDGDGNVHKETQQSHGMTWAQGDENYYATQDTDHGYRSRIENQHRFLSNLTDYPSQCDYSQSQRYGRRQPDIQYSMQNLEIDEHSPHQMHGHQSSSIGTNSGRSKTRRRNRGSATDSIGEGNQRSSIEISHSSGTGTYSQGFGYYNQNMEHLMPSQPLPQCTRRIKDEKWEHMILHKETTLCSQCRNILALFYFTRIINHISLQERLVGWPVDKRKRINGKEETSADNSRPSLRRQHYTKPKDLKHISNNVTSQEAEAVEAIMKISSSEICNNDIANSSDMVKENNNSSADLAAGKETGNSSQERDKTEAREEIENKFVDYNRERCKQPPSYCK